MTANEFDGKGERGIAGLAKAYVWIAEKHLEDEECIDRELEANVARETRRGVILALMSM